MTIALVAGTVMILSVIAGIPEIFETLDNYLFARSQTIIKIRVESQKDIDFVERIGLYGDFWFTKEEANPRPVWHRKNAKKSACVWAPLPPSGRKMFSEIAWGN